MSQPHVMPSLEGEKLTLDEVGPRILIGGSILGVVGFAAAIAIGVGRNDHLASLGWSYLLNFAYFLSLSLGALFFVAVGHLTRATWNVVSRRIGEVVAVNLVLMAVMAIPLMLMASRVFPWASGLTHAPEELLEHKRPFLNLPFFYLRWVVYFAIWAGYAVWFWRQSVAQDRSGDPRITMRMESRAGLSLLLFALSVNFASFDLLMSLDPTWFSTIFGPYYFAAGVVGFFSLLTLLTFFLQSQGRLTRAIHVEHYHDYGKLMFAFVFFWAYLAFSQYMLIWYANIPEETAWLLRREENGWGWIGLVLVFGHFLVPFAGLLSRFTKRLRATLFLWALWILVMHWIDLYWVVMPEIRPLDPGLDSLDLLCFLGFAGFYAAALSRWAGAHSLLPERDPRLQDALAFENA